jgi:glycosyltransferase involved in cell wall biosynthesis
MDNMMVTPYVSVVLPVYNGELYLRETIESVLAQSYPGIELIAVNDGSTDTSAEIISSYPGVKSITQENKGVPFARNAGVSASRGDFVAFIDQDDLWLSHKIQSQVEAMVAQPEAQYCITQQIFYLADNTEKPEWCPQEWLDKPLAGYSPSKSRKSRSSPAQKQVRAWSVAPRRNHPSWRGSSHQPTLQVPLVTVQTLLLPKHCNCRATCR